jgi:hypothetical protein
LRSVNYLANAAPRDGTVIATFARDMPLIGILGNPNARFDASKFTWLGSSSSYGNDAYLLFTRTDAQVKSIADARRAGGPPLLLGGTGEGASGNDVSAVLRDALGLNLKLIAGYPDSNALFLAVDRKGSTALRRAFRGTSRMRSGCGQGGMRARAVRAFDPPSRFSRRSTARELAKTRRRALIELAKFPTRCARSRRHRACRRIAPRR